jgi:hypothetical protein
MANPKIIPKRSTQSAKVPTTSDLALGEIAINHADKKLYARHPGSGVVQEIGGGGGGGGGSTSYIVQSDFSSPYSYIGRAALGTEITDAGWSITRIEISSDGSTTKLNATGVWSNRSSLTYT